MSLRHLPQIISNASLTCLGHHHPSGEGSLSREQGFISKRVFLALAKWGFAAILLVAAGRQIASALKQLEGKEISLEPFPLCLSAVLYGAGMACFGAYWRQTIHDMGGQLRAVDSQRAYFASQLGKYIPGKAWVALIRCGLVGRDTVPATVIVASTAYESLAMMASGALFALLALSVAGAESWVLWLAAGLWLALTLAVQPWLFRRMVALATLPFRGNSLPAVNPVSYATLLKGGFYFIPGWGMAGLSLVAVAHGSGVAVTGLSSVLLACGSAALAMAGGFAILIVPAGLGVREWILMHTLGPTLGAGNAVLIAIVARVMNVTVELLVAGGLHFSSRRNVRNA
jgi:glycosyltransferase 2 family protein